MNPPTNVHYEFWGVVRVPIDTIHDGSDPAPTPKGAWPGAKKGV